MKITEKNLKRGKLSKNNTLKIGSNIYYFKKCNECSEKYLGTKNSNFCTNKCTIQNLNKNGMIKRGGNKLSFEYVKNYIEKEGYKLLSSEYKNSHEKLELKCINNHIYHVKFYSFKNGNRCPICVRKRLLSGRNKLSFEYVKNYIEKEGYKLLSSEYKNSKSYLNIICPKGHEYNVIWSNFQQGQRCSICSYKENGKKLKLSYSYVKEQIKSEGYKLLSKEYKGSKEKVKVMCPEGHEYKVRYERFRDGDRCRKCGYINRKNNYKHIKNEFEKEGYILLSKEYINNKKKLKVKCPKGHEYKTKWNNFQQGWRCPICWNKSTSSKLEIKVFEYVKNITNEYVIPNDRTQIVNTKTGYNLELDIWIPELRKAIEFNGIYWHSSKYQKFKDKEKVKQCKDKGIDLMVIEEQEWLDNKEKCLKVIKKFIKGY